MKMTPTGTQTGFSHGTGEYRLDADGTIDVPDEAVEVALSHGFRLASPDERRAPRRPKSDR